MAELAKDKVGKVGWFESARYEDGTPVAMVAAIHEFGAPGAGIPPRPFMRPTIAAEQDNWRALAKQGAMAILKGTHTTAQVMEGIGLQAAGDIARTISQVMEPPLKPATVAAKRRKRANKGVTGNLSKPLVDSGLMISTVTNTVEDA